jgi:ribosomal protein L7/L12
VNRPSIRSILDSAQVSLAFIDGLNVMGVNLAAPVPMVEATPEPSKYVAGLIRAGQYASNGEKILAIKEIRALFGTGLKESKDIVDAFCPPKPYPPPY